MLKILMAGMVLGIGIAGAGAASAQMPRKPAPADTPRLLLVDDEHKHKNKHEKNFGRRGDDDEDRDEDDNRGRSSNRTSRGRSSWSQGYYSASPYAGAPRGIAVTVSTSRATTLIRPPITTPHGASRDWDGYNLGRPQEHYSGQT